MFHIFQNSSSDHHTEHVIDNYYVCIGQFNLPDIADQTGGYVFSSYCYRKHER